MIPQVRVLRAALWRSLSSEGVPLRCGLQTWGLLCEVCVVTVSTFSETPPKNGKLELRFGGTYNRVFGGILKNLPVQRKIEKWFVPGDFLGPTLGTFRVVNLHLL